MSKVSTNTLNKKVVKKNDILKRGGPNELLSRSTELADKLPEPTESFQILQRSLNFVGMIGIGLGFEMKYEWKSNRRFVFTKCITAFVWLLMLYTQCLYVYQHAIVRTAEVFAIYGIGVSAILKLYCFETYVKNLTALMKSTSKICQQCTGVHAEKLRKRCLQNFTFYKCIVLLAFPITGTYLYYPVQSYVTNGELVPFVPLEIMFIDQSTMSGYCIASSLMVFSGILALLSSFYMALTFVIIILNYGPRVDLFEANFKELDELWSGVSASSIAYRHMFLRNICRKAIDMRQYYTMNTFYAIHYIAEVKEIFDRKMFLFFVFAYLSQILCLYQIRVNNWVPGYGLAIGFFLEMIFYCLMGTKLTLENDRLCYIISQSNWYTYDMRSQKIILVLLNISLNCDELWIGPLKPLSVFTATEIVKSIYTYYTVMMEVL